MTVEPGKDFLACDYCQSMHFPDPNADGVRVLGESSERNCPRCSIALTHASVGGERVLYCERCRGLLVNMGAFMVVLEELRSRHASSEYVGEQPDWDNLQRTSQCPECGKKMNTHGYAGPGNVIIDSCSECCVNWLDYGEFQRIVRAPDRKFATLIDEDERRQIELESASGPTWGG